MFGPEVAVALAQAPGRGARSQHLRMPLQRSIERVERRDRRRVAQRWLQQHAPVHRLRGLETRDVGGLIELHALSAQEKLRKALAKPVNLVNPHAAGVHRHVEHPLARNATHLHQPVDDGCRHGASRADRQCAVRPLQQRQHTQVDARRQASVEPHLLAAVELARRQRREVQELGPDRLLQLQHRVFTQENP